MNVAAALDVEGPLYGSPAPMVLSAELNMSPGSLLGAGSSGGGEGIAGSVSSLKSVPPTAAMSIIVTAVGEGLPTRRPPGGRRPWPEGSQQETLSRAPDRAALRLRPA